MTYKELLESLQKLNENALSKNDIVWDIDDQEFDENIRYDFVEILKEILME